MFYLTNYWITNALIEANNRGVEIKIIVDFTLQKEPKSQIDELKNLHVLDCIECGCCAYICPAHIPLLDYCKLAKIELKNLS